MQKLLFIVVFSLLWTEVTAQSTRSLHLYAGENMGIM